MRLPTNNTIDYHESIGIKRKDARFRASITWFSVGPRVRDGERAVVRAHSPLLSPILSAVSRK